jgi:uncharacterized membrane protein YoaT (DUF817 family)
MHSLPKNIKKEHKQTKANESDFKAPNLPLSLRLKVSGCHYNNIYNNTWTKQVKQLSVLLFYSIVQVDTDEEKQICLGVLFAFVCLCSFFIFFGKECIEKIFYPFMVVSKEH